MTPIGHAACGVAGGGIVSPLLNKFLKIPYRALVPLFFISSLIPDIDAASLLTDHKVYFGKLWYSHHMLAHSIWGAVMFATFLALIYLTGAIFIRGLVNLFRQDKVPLEWRLRRFIGAWIASFLGCLLHFLGDLPTPPGPWKGIALFWPSNEMYGGWSNIFWHNWYIIYISIMYMIIYLSMNSFAGVLSAIRIKYTRWAGEGIRYMIVLISIIFAVQLGSFVKNANYKAVGFQRWDALNRSMVPEKYMKDANRLYHKATIFWRKKLVKRSDLIKLANRALAWFEDVHRTVAPKVGVFMPGFRSDEDEMALYRSLQASWPGMGDLHRGDYRVWIFRDKFPNPKYYDRAFTWRRIGRLDKNIMQMSNAWMLIYRIDERDKEGAALRVSRVYHSNRIYVPGNLYPQMNEELAKQSSFSLWNHDKFGYNLVPRIGISRYNNKVRGLFPSISTVPGLLRGNWKTGVALHYGMWSAGCIIAIFGHFDIGTHLQNAFFPIWETTDKIIDITKLGSVFRSRKRIWGRLLIIKDPEPIEMKDAG